MEKIKISLRTFCFILVMLILFNVNASHVRAIGGQQTVGQIIFGVSGTNRHIQSKPITTSQVLHQKGYITAVGVSYAVTQGASASASITATFKAIAADIAFGLGFSQNASFTVTTAMTFTIPATVANGYYRISVAHPGYLTTKREWSTDYVLNPAATRSIAYVPRPIESYHYLENYG